MSRESDLFEMEMAAKFGLHGFWASIFPKAHDGSQPADIITLNHKGQHLVDAKLCANDRFVFSRMEDNQIHAMDWFEKRCGGHGWFAIKYCKEDQIYMVSNHFLLRLQEEGYKSIGKIPEQFRWENWINDYCDRR